MRWLLLLVLGLSSAASADEATRDREALEILDGVLKADTSHGNESLALGPIAARLRAAGIPCVLLESAPGRGNLVARLRGSGKKKPLMLLAHVDVVPTDGQPWTSAPFAPTERDGYLVARGIGDKSMVAAFTAEVLELQRSKTKLSRDVILALTAGEETGGVEGVKWLLAQPKERTLGFSDAAIALNEGGYLVLDRDEKRILSVGLGAAEKTYQSYGLTVKGPGGHSSVPNARANPVTTLARALVRLGELRFPAHVIPATRDALTFRAGVEAPALAAALRRTLASGRPTAEDEKLLATIPTIDSILCTTCVATMLSGSPQANVLPTSVSATVNCRVMPDETREATRATLVRAVDDSTVVVTPLEDMGEGGASPVRGEVPDAVRAVAKRMGTEVAEFPVMGTGASDSRHLRKTGILAYGISAWPMSMEDGQAGHGAHGADERRPTRWHADGMRFVDQVVRELTK